MEKRLPGSLVNSYGIASLAFNQLMFMALYEYAFFMQDVLLIRPVHYGIIMSIAPVVDAISVFISGGIIQKTQFRWGQFRSWLLLPPLTTAIFFTLTFTNMPLPYLPKLFYLGLAYILAHVSLNFSFNGHLGLISVLSRNIKDRMRLSARNMQFGMASQIIYSLIVLKLILLPFRERFGDSHGFFYAVLLISVFQILGYWNLFYRTKDYDKYDPNKKLLSSNKMSVLEMFQMVLGNKELLRLMIADVAVNLVIFSLAVISPFYFKYVIGDEAWRANYMLVLGFSSFASTIIGPYVANRIGKKNTYIFAGLYGLVGYTTLNFFNVTNPLIFTGIVCGSILGAGLSGPIRHAMYMDAAEYSYYKTGKDASAFIVSMFTVPVKLAVILAQAVVAGYAMNFIGYEPDMIVTEQFMTNMIRLVSFVPAACCLIACGIMASYKLTDENLTMYMEANAKKRAEESGQ